ncbi:MAG TPA: adenosine deaminase [Candidatus Baltobacteraceae bacterium]|nr:adenosine deaminase [Candidatus Baltobacteraceae bacterium]
MKPLVDLHLHLDGSLRIKTMLDIAVRERVKLPATDARGLKRALRVGKIRASLADYLTAFPITLAVLQSRYAIERAVAELLQDCAAEGLKYVEIRFSPLLHMEAGLTAPEAVEAALRGVERGNAYGIRANLILCSLRHFDPRDSMTIALLAHAYRNPRGGVVAVDLAGNDALDCREHSRAFRWAKERGLGVTIHAAESGPPERIREALTLFGADRIGHAVRAAEDPMTLFLMATYGTAIEVCLTSNVQTRTVESYATHPARDYYKRGLRVTLNTDNRLLADTTLYYEYSMAALHWWEIERADTRALQCNAIEAAFAPPDWKVELYQALDAPPNP